MADNIGRLEYTVGIDDSELARELHQAEAHVRETAARISGIDAKAEVDLQKARFDTQMAQAQRQLNEFRAQKATATVDADISQLNRGITAAQARLRTLKDQKLAITYDQSALRTLTNVEKSLRAQHTEIARLQSSYAKLDGILEKAERKARTTIGETRTRAITEARNVSREMDDIETRLRRVGAALPEGIHRGLTGRQRIFRDFEGFINRFSDIAGTRVNIGPFTTTIRGLTVALTFLGPLLTSVTGALGSLISTLGSATAGAAAIGGAAITGFAAALTGVAIAVKPVISDVKSAMAAQKAYNDAVLKYGKGSEEAAKAQEKLNQTMKGVDPSAREGIKTVSKLGAEFRKLTSGAARQSIGAMLTSGGAAGRQLLPGFARFTSTTLTQLGSGVSGIFARIGAQSGGFNRIFAGFSAALPPVLSGLGKVAEAFIRISASAARFLGPLGAGFDRLAGRLLDWASNTERVDAATSKWFTSLQSVMRFIGALSRVVVHFFSAGVNAGNEFTDSLTRSLNRWDRFLQSVEGRNKVQEFFRNAVATTEQLGRAIAPLIGLFVQWSNALQPITRGMLDVVTVFTRFINLLGKISIGNNALRALGVTLATYFAVTKIAGIVNAISRMAAAWRAVTGAAAGATAAQRLAAASAALTTRGAIAGGAAAGAGGAAAGAGTRGTLTGLGSGAVGGALARFGPSLLRFAGPIGAGISAGALFNSFATQGEAAFKKVNNRLLQSLKQSGDAARRVGDTASLDRLANRADRAASNFDPRSKIYRAFKTLAANLRADPLVIRLRMTEPIQRLNDLIAALKTRFPKRVISEIVTNAPNVRTQILALQAVMKGIPPSKVLKILHNAKNAAEAYKDLRNAIDRIPPNKKTRVNADTREALKNIQELKRWLDSLRATDVSIPQLTPTPPAATPRARPTIGRPNPRGGGRITGGYRNTRVRRFQGGGIAALVSPGEEIIEGGQSYLVPGEAVAADNVPVTLQPNAAVLTSDGRSMMAAGYSIDEALERQIPHFRGGGRARLGTVIKGRVSTFGPPGEGAGGTAYGFSSAHPGISLRWPGTGFDSPQSRSLGLGWYEVKIRGHRGILQDIDKGPHQKTGRVIDVTGHGAQQMGIRGGFPTDSIGTATLLGFGKKPPTNVSPSSKRRTQTEGTKVSTFKPFSMRESQLFNPGMSEIETGQQVRELIRSHHPVFRQPALRYGAPTDFLNSLVESGHVDPEEFREVTNRGTIPGSANRSGKGSSRRGIPAFKGFYFVGHGVWDFGRFVQSLGYHVGENPHFGGVGSGHGHYPPRDHFSGAALDITGGDLNALANWAMKNRKAIGIPTSGMPNLGKGTGVLWQVPNHYDHVHVSFYGPDNELGHYREKARAGRRPGQRTAVGRRVPSPPAKRLPAGTRRRIGSGRGAIPLKSLWDRIYPLFSPIEHASSDQVRSQMFQAFTTRARDASYTDLDATRIWIGTRQQQLAPMVKAARRDRLSKDPRRRISSHNMLRRQRNLQAFHALVNAMTQARTERLSGYGPVDELLSKFTYDEQMLGYSLTERGIAEDSAQGIAERVALLTSEIGQLEPFIGRLTEAEQYARTHGDVDAAKEYSDKLRDVNLALASKRADVYTLTHQPPTVTADTQAQLDQANERNRILQQENIINQAFARTAGGPGDIGTGNFLSARQAGSFGGGPTVVINTLHPADPDVYRAIGNAATAGFSLQGYVSSPRLVTGV